MLKKVILLLFQYLCKEGLLGNNTSVFLVLGYWCHHKISSKIKLDHEVAIFDSKEWITHCGDPNGVKTSIAIIYILPNYNVIQDIGLGWLLQS